MHTNAMHTINALPYVWNIVDPPGAFSNTKKMPVVSQYWSVNNYSTVQIEWLCQDWISAWDLEWKYILWLIFNIFYYFSIIESLFVFCKSLNFIKRLKRFDLRHSICMTKIFRFYFSIRSVFFNSILQHTIFFCCRTNPTAISITKTTQNKFLSFTVVQNTGKYYRRWH